MPELMQHPKVREPFVKEIEFQIKLVPGYFVAVQ